MAATTNKTTVSTTKYTPYDVSKDYAKAEEAYRKAQQAAYDSQKSSIEYQKQQFPRTTATSEATYIKMRG